VTTAILRAAIKETHQLKCEVNSSLVGVRALPFANKETIQTFQFEKMRYTRQSVHTTRQYVNQ
jgi:hypothetical protein